MTLEFFSKFYHLDEYNVLDAHIQKNKLYLRLSTAVKLELIANGYRPEMDVEQVKTYIFEVNHEDEIFPNISSLYLKKEKEDYFILLDNLSLKIVGNEITITD